MGKSEGSSYFQYLQLYMDPMLRLQDVPGMGTLLHNLSIAPEDPYLQEVLAHVVREQEGKAVMSGDPFWPNYPAPGVLPPLERGRIALASLPTGEVFSVSAGSLTRNLLITGPTGGGKTNILKLIVLGALMGGMR